MGCTKTPSTEANRAPDFPARFLYAEPQRLVRQATVGLNSELLMVSRKKKLAALVLCLAAWSGASAAVHHKHRPAKKAVSTSRAHAAKASYHPHVDAAATPLLGSSAVLVADQLTGARLLARNADAPRPIASISKLMTAMVTLDAHLNMGEVLKVTDDDVDRLRHSSSRLPVGTKLPRGEMLRLALMSSENRAAHALGRTYPGGMPAFVAAMNQKARALGLHSAQFVEPTGLSAANVASASDLAAMVSAASAYPDIHAYTTTAEATVAMGRGKQVFRNTNPLVRQARWDIDVSKTGFINEAGRCLVMQATINQRPTLIILLDGAHKDTRVLDATNIKRWLERTKGTLERPLVAQTT